MRRARWLSLGASAGRGTPHAVVLMHVQRLADRCARPCVALPPVQP